MPINYSNCSAKAFDISTCLNAVVYALVYEKDIRELVTSNNIPHIFLEKNSEETKKFVKEMGKYEKENMVFFEIRLGLILNDVLEQYLPGIKLHGFFEGENFWGETFLSYERLKREQNAITSYCHIFYSVSDVEDTKYSLYNIIKKDFFYFDEIGNGEFDIEFPVCTEEDNNKENTKKETIWRTPLFISQGVCLDYAKAHKINFKKINHSTLYEISMCVDKNIEFIINPSAKSGSIISSNVVKKYINELRTKESKEIIEDRLELLQYSFPLYVLIKDIDYFRKEGIANFNHSPAICGKKREYSLYLFDNVEDASEYADNEKFMPTLGTRPIGIIRDKEQLEQVLTYAYTYLETFNILINPFSCNTFSYPVESFFQLFYDKKIKKDKSAQPMVELLDKPVLAKSIYSEKIIKKIICGDDDNDQIKLAYYGNEMDVLNVLSALTETKKNGIKKTEINPQKEVRLLELFIQKQTNKDNLYLLLDKENVPITKDNKISIVLTEKIPFTKESHVWEFVIEEGPLAQMKKRCKYIAFGFFVQGNKVRQFVLDISKMEEALKHVKENKDSCDRVIMNLIHEYGMTYNEAERVTLASMMNKEMFDEFYKIALDQENKHDSTAIKKFYQALK